MKKKILMSVLLMVVTSMVFVSCSKDAEETTISKNPLEETLWSKDEVSFFGDPYTRYIEFVDNNKVKVWSTYLGEGPYTGTYAVDGGKVKFYNLYDRYWDWLYIEASYSSKSMTITYCYDKNESRTYTETFRKEL